MSEIAFAKLTSSRSSLALLLLLALSGCATNGPQRRSHTAWPDPPPEGQTLIFFYTQRTDPLRKHPTIYVDTVKVFTLRGDAYSWCYVKTGFHTVSATWEPYDPSFNLRTRYLFASGATIYLRLNTDFARSGDRRIIRGQMHAMDAGTAKLETERSTYIPALTTTVGLP